MTTGEAKQLTIRTPDQRLRVFVSSTLEELAAERKGARRAIERLSAAPVMFELGARPHPPRALYRAYLDQSDIFVGIYWEKYGWVAPGETVSGLEDEYNLARPEMPKLMYFKETDGTRDPSLTGMLNRIRDDDSASYKHFRDARELARLLVTDLAVLLAERFDDSRAPVERDSSHTVSVDEAEPEPQAFASTLPRALSRLFGRERDIGQLSHILCSADVRLVTLTGPGGIGKTRLAIEVARAVRDDIPEVVFVSLSAVAQASQVASALAQALGVADTGDAPLEQKLSLALSKRQMLLVLDNFEHVLDAAPLVSTLLARAEGLIVLVTSRALLKLGGEHTYEVDSLDIPDDRASPWHDGEAMAPSVELFIERARSVKPDLVLLPDTVHAIESIVRKLEGVPLAIELAAARTRILTPAVLLSKLERQLPVLMGSQRDAPARQKAVRDTIEWSTRLLSDDERSLLWRVGVFAGRFSMEAAEAVAEPDRDVVTLLEGLIDASLVRQQELGGHTYLRLLATVREFSMEQLESIGLRAPVEAAHAAYYVQWAQGLGMAVTGPKASESRTLLTDQLDNLRVAVHALLSLRDWETLSRLTFSLFPYWLEVGLLGEIGGWMREMLSSADPPGDHARAVGLLLGAGESFFDNDEAWSMPDEMSESVELFRRTGDPIGEAMASWSLGLTYAVSSPPDLIRARSTTQAAIERLHTLGLSVPEALALLDLGRLDLVEHEISQATERFQAALRASGGDPFSTAVSLNHLGWAELFAGNTKEAARLLLSQLDAALALEARDQVLIYALESFEGLAIALEDVEAAGLLNGAARAVSDRTGIHTPFRGVFLEDLEGDLRRSHRGEEFEAAITRGREMAVDEAIALSRRVGMEAGAVRR